jgi:hypothetical protein
MRKGLVRLVEMNAEVVSLPATVTVFCLLEVAAFAAAPEVPWRGIRLTAGTARSASTRFKESIVGSYSETGHHVT